MLEQSYASAHRLVHLLADAGLTAATCESLTGGLVGATITSVPGASAIFRGGLITYASVLKTVLAGVDADWIDEHGVINAMTARQMATGCAHACGRPRAGLYWCCRARPSGRAASRNGAHCRGPRCPGVHPSAQSFRGA